MILYPPTVLFRLTRAIEKALVGLKAGKPLIEGDAVDLDGFKEIVGIPVLSIDRRDVDVQPHMQ